MSKMLLIFACLAIGFFLLERLIPWRSQRLFRTGFLADIFYIPIHYLMRVVVNGFVATALVEYGAHVMAPSGSSPEEFGLLSGQPVWLQAIIVLVILDFIFYVTHRLKHKWNWWWRLHETHHSSKELDFLSSVRFHPLEKALDRIIFLLPLTVLGPSEGAILIWASVDVLVGMLIHSNTNIRIGPLIYLFVGPEMHRWHHSKDPSIQGHNFGNNFSVFDWIFGTAYVSHEKTAEFGIEEENYPQGNIVRQFLFAFRPAKQASGGGVMHYEDSLEQEG